MKFSSKKITANFFWHGSELSIYEEVCLKSFIKNGFKVVIYANHMLRAAYPAMQNAAMTILKNQRSFELENKISSVKDVINLIK